MPCIPFGIPQGMSGGVVHAAARLGWAGRFWSLLDHKSSLAEMRGRAWVRLEDLWVVTSMAARTKEERERAQRLKEERSAMDPTLAAEMDLREEELRKEQGRATHVATLVNSYLRWSNLNKIQ